MFENNLLLWWVRYLHDLKRSKFGLLFKSQFRKMFQNTFS